MQIRLEGDTYGQTVGYSAQAGCGVQAGHIWKYIFNLPGRRRGGWLGNYYVT